MKPFASGWKRTYYGTRDVIVYRLNRDGAAANHSNPVFGANVSILIYGDAFWPTYASPSMVSFAIDTRRCPRSTTGRFTSTPTRRSPFPHAPEWLGNNLSPGRLYLSGGFHATSSRRPMRALRSFRGDAPKS